MDCADKLEWDSGEGEAFRSKAQDAMRRQAGKAKAAAILADKGLDAAWAIYCAADAGEREEGIIKDIVGKLVQYGNLSDAQLAFLSKLLAGIATRAERLAARAAASAAAAPVPCGEDRIKVEGKIVSIKPADDFYPVRMTIEHASGWRVFGTRPAHLAAFEVGAEVAFMAAVKPSHKDPKFGFFSRPTKAK